MHRLVSARLCIAMLLLGTSALALANAPSNASGDFAYAEPYLETVGEAESIPLRAVAAQLQDDQGLLWIGTQFGLLRFDGYRFRTFVHDSRDPQSLAGDFVQSLWLGPDRKLWIGTSSDGLSVLDLRTELFENFRHDAASAAGLSAGPIWALAGDAVSYCEGVHLTFEGAQCIQVKMLRV